MITRYDDFIFENMVQLIVESEVAYSKKFKKLLDDIDSPVSKYLSSIENKDFDVQSNFFDIADNKDQISFISDRKAKEIMGDDGKKKAVYKGGPILTHNIKENGAIFKLLGYDPKGDSGYDPSEGEVGEVISRAVSPTSGRTFLYMKFPDGECVLNEVRVSYEDAYKEVWSKNRQSVRTGRGLS